MTLLVAMTSWASACDLACSLGRTHSVCKFGGAATTSTAQVASGALAGRAQHAMAMGQSMAGAMEGAMEGAMAMPDGTTLMEADTGRPHLHSSYCTHSPCNESSITAISNSATQHPVRALPVVAFVRPIVSTSFGHVSSIAATQQPRDLQPFDPLSVNLRI